MNFRFCLLLLGAVAGAAIQPRVGAAEATPSESVRPSEPPTAATPAAPDPVVQPAESAGDATPATPALTTNALEAEASTAVPIEPKAQLAPPAPAAAAPRPTMARATGGQPTGVVLNFKGARLSEVLNYLSEAAGFVVVLETEVSGTVNVISHQPLNPDEAVDLLNSILVDKGYTAIRSGRILKIVDLEGAARKLLPVRTGSDPAQIPPKDELVTQIIPVRYADAVKLVDNLTPLLPDNAEITANESSNAIVLTDTQASVRRMAEIIRALDTSISGISTIKVFPLRYSDATELAKVVSELFKSDSSSRGSSRGGGPAEFFARMRGGGDRGGSSRSGNSEARAMAARVVAVADERTNSLVVSAPDELMPTIEQLVAQVDTNVSDLTEVRIFRLEFADATETADLLMQLFSEDAYSSNSRSGRSGFRPPFMMLGGRSGPPSRSSNNQSSERKLEQSRVVAVGDPRTNSLLVSASHDLMASIAEMIGRLDSDSSKRQRVYVYPLEHADVDNVAAILQSMFQSSTSSRSGSRGATGRTTTTGSSTLSNRRTSGASIDPSLGGRGAGGPGGGGGR